jgi:hypothetical protein
VTLQVEEDALEVLLIKDLLLLGGAEEERSATEVVDLAGDALGVIVDEGEEAVGEDGSLAADDAEVMLDVGSGFLEVEGFEVVADGDTLVEGLEGGEAEFVGEVRLAEEDEGEERGRVHVVVEEEAELVEEFWGQEMGLVDDEEDEAAFAGQVGEGGAELGKETGKAKGWFDLEGEEELAVEGGDGEMRIGEIDNGEEVGVEGVGKGAKGSGLAGADVAGDEGRETFLESEGEAALDLAVGAGGEEVSAGDGLGEGGGGEAIEIMECGHRLDPPRGRVGRSEWTRAAAE